MQYIFKMTSLLNYIAQEISLTLTTFDQRVLKSWNPFVRITSKPILNFLPNERKKENILFRPTSPVELAFKSEIIPTKDFVVLMASLVAH